MGAAMVPIALLVMRSRYPGKGANVIAALASVAVILASFGTTRAQGAVGDDQLLRPMIPRHTSAIRMCQVAQVQHAEIRDLCGQIVSSQQREIDQKCARSWIVEPVEVFGDPAPRFPMGAARDSLDTPLR